MKKILLFGAGKSTTCLIDYLIQQAAHYNWHIVIADGNLELAQNKAAGSSRAVAVQANVKDDEKRNELIERADIVISMLPPSLHSLVAKNCVAAGRHLLTASYVDEAMQKLEPEIKKKGLLFLCEMGLDPGIDHMSAMQMIYQLKNAGAHITSFFSCCGGLVAPDSDDNPWHYKISWNPRNVVLAGKQGASYRFENEIINLGYPQMFDPQRLVQIPDCGWYAWYPNRDSLAYIPLYGLEDTATFLRATLRHPDFCMGWRKIAQLYLTDETRTWDTTGLSYKRFLELHLKHFGLSNAALESEPERKQLAFLGLFDDVQINNGICAAADILQTAVEQKLMLRPKDKDMIIMIHKIGYEREGQIKETTSTLIVKGHDATQTAMAKTVGLPLGIAAMMVLQGKIKLTGLHIPVIPEIYDPVLNALSEEGIAFQLL